jgi:predicted Zn-dependent peptidase
LLREYAHTHFTPQRMVVAGVGVDHDTFVDQVANAFRDLPTSPKVKHEVARYTGGGARRIGKTRDDSKPSDEERVHFAIMFPSGNILSLSPLSIDSVYEMSCIDK